MADYSKPKAATKPVATKSVSEMSTLAIEDYLRQRKLAEHEAKRRLEREAEKQFVDSSKIDIYEASDYCGLRTGSLEFYFGYEVTDNSNEDEWCFVARENGIAELTIPQSKLWPKNEGMLWYLLSGIGQYLQLRADAKVNDLELKDD